MRGQQHSLLTFPSVHRSTMSWRLASRIPISSSNLFQCGTTAQSSCKKEVDKKSHNIAIPINHKTPARRRRVKIRDHRRPAILRLRTRLSPFPEIANCRPIQFARIGIRWSVRSGIHENTVEPRYLSRVSRNSPR